MMPLTIVPGFNCHLARLIEEEYPPGPPPSPVEQTVVITKTPDGCKDEKIYYAMKIEQKSPHPVYDKEYVLPKTTFGTPVTAEMFINNDFSPALKRCRTRFHRQESIKEDEEEQEKKTKDKDSAGHMTSKIFNDNAATLVVGSHSDHGVPFAELAE